MNLSEPFHVTNGDRKGRVLSPVCCIFRWFISWTKQH